MMRASTLEAEHHNYDSVEQVCNPLGRTQALLPLQRSAAQHGAPSPQIFPLSTIHATIVFTTKSETVVHSD